jgi:hypothetical protein
MIVNNGLEGMWRGYVSAYFKALAWRDLEKEAVCSSETSVDFKRTTRRYIPEDITLHKNRCENLKCYSVNVVGVSADIMRAHLPNSRQKCYRLSQRDRFLTAQALMYFYKLL